MEQDFDLFGDPIPANHGRRGRPQHIATVENRNKVKLLLALGWSNVRIASALGITQPTLRRNYFQELKARDDQRPKMEAAFRFRVFSDAMGGNASAQKHWERIMDRDLGYMPPVVSEPDDDADPESKTKLGKKAQTLQDSYDVPKTWSDICSPPVKPN